MGKQLVLPPGMKQVPVHWKQEFCLWHLKRGPKDSGFPSKFGGFFNLLAALNAIADYNMERLKAGLSKIGVSLHGGLELALGLGPGETNPEFAKKVNTPEAITYPDLLAWMNDESRPNFAGTPDIGGIPVAGFGREIWGNRGSYCSTDPLAREIGWWTWVEAKKILDDMRQYPWGQDAFLLNWGGNNSLDADEADPDEIVTVETYTESELWSLERQHLIRVANELGEVVKLEPKLFHPGWLVAGTTKLGAMLAAEVNKAVGKIMCTINVEFAHHWSDGANLRDGFKLLRKAGAFVDCKGRAQMHGGGGIKAGINLAAAIESKKGIKRGNLCVTPDMDYRLANITSEQMAEVRGVIRDTIAEAGIIPETWDVDKVTVLVSWDVRHAGQDDPLTMQVRSIGLLEEIIARETARLGVA